MRILIVRHAIAFERDRTRWPDDADRPLTPEGRRRFAPLASRFGRLYEGVSRMWTSPLVRARETAAILERRAHWPRAELTPALLPDEDPDRMVKLLHAAPARDTVALVGHEPHMTKLTSHLLTGRNALEMEFKKGGVAAVAFPGWPERGQGVLEAFIPPRAFRKS
jgi:phosphohistidine phosphatase